LRPFAQSGVDADGWVVLRRALFEVGRLPAVDLTESHSRLADDDPDGLAQRVKADVARGNAALTSYLSQPFFVAEQWTSRPGEVTERQDMLEQIQRLIEQN
jgi:F0F1-type ATP synthase beta subunit